LDAKYAQLHAADVFSTPTYLVLDLPQPICTEVLEMRQRFDLYQAGLPPEITVAGSSGAGTVAQGQDPLPVLRAIEAVARRHLPFTCSFESMRRFSGVPVFWLCPRDRAPFDALHRALLESGIKFDASPFPFNPHCTVSSKEELSKHQEAELLASPVPQLEFLLDELRVYQVAGGQAHLLQSFKLGR
jgi:2'-5' RNA ligase superfamily